MPIDDGGHIAVAGLCEIHGHASRAGYRKAGRILEYSSCLPEPAHAGHINKTNRICSDSRRSRILDLQCLTDEKEVCLQKNIKASASDMRSIA